LIGESEVFMKELVTVKEAAKRLGVHPQTLYKAVRAGKYKQETINLRPLLVWENGGLVRSDSVKTLK